MRISRLVPLILTSAALGSCSSTEPQRADPTPGANAAIGSTPTPGSATTTAGLSVSEEPAGSVQGGDATAAAATRALFDSVGPDDPGCTVAVRRGDDIVFAEAFGAASLDPVIPMTTGTVVDIGSTSKQFTASAILLLADRGLVDLDAPVAEYLDGLPAWADEVTVTQMVHHTSGIPDYGDLLDDEGISDRDVATIQMALDVLAGASELDFEPGEGWEYSNSNYFLLAEIVLAVTGTDLGEFLTSEVFAPLGMNAVMDPVTVIPGKAESYALEDDEWVDADSPWEQLGDGAIQTTPTELLKWASEYWEPTLGPADINEQRFADAADTGEESRYGFGIIESFDVEGRRILDHDGAWGGFVTTFAADPVARIAVTATCAAEESDPPDLESTTLLDLWR